MHGPCMDLGHLEGFVPVKLCVDPASTPDR
jgi:hypothetical protein